MEKGLLAEDLPKVGDITKRLILCVCVCICVYVYMCICVYVSVYVYICVYIYIYMYVCIYIYMYIFIYVCIQRERERERDRDMSCIIRIITIITYMAEGLLAEDLPLLLPVPGEGRHLSGWAAAV